MAMPTEETIGRILQRTAREAPDRVYCTFLGETITCAQLNARANQIAHLLLANGLKKGDRVGLMLPSHPEHLYAIFALAKLGLVRVPVNVHLVGEPLAHILRHMRPDLVIADAGHRQKLQALDSPPQRVLWRDDGHGEFDAWRTQPDSEPPFDVAPDDIIVLTPSSGTTGLPKGVRKSDRHMRAGPATVLRMTDAQPGDVFLFWEQLHHGAGVTVSIAALIGGFQLAMQESFSASRFWDQARAAGATHIHYLGSVLPMLLKQPERPDDREHRVRIAWGGGCPSAIWKRFEQRFGVQIREGYGMSELLNFVTLNPDGRVGSIGRPLSCYDIRLADDAGRAVADGEIGEITVRARIPELGFLGYLDNPEAEAASYRDGWFLTGDLATQDADGHLFYAGRKKDMLRRRGINISAWEVESVFARHQAIEEVALVGVPSELGEDELKLFVRLKDGHRVSERELVEWSLAHLPYFQVPRYMVFIDEFPKTPTQRIQKKELSRSTDAVWDREREGLTAKRL
ncbi:ATP-dependent acyl-CoA ligase [Verticiella sediminum]|uniref:ATP-dependent acyl-CoA ligase n=2 Tax=Verticiella sediminum TaxID=1247510 RepID=A0A556A8G0_9BURK|nr:ATP-dependent acyl-CoA ligase [Verticiella sediminum]